MIILTAHSTESRGALCGGRGIELDEPQRDSSGQ
jgi:hypothetical protein